MSKLDWDKARRATRVAQPVDLPRGGRPQRTHRQMFGFPARWPGTCSNCGNRFAVGQLVKFNAERHLVHGRICPRKPRG